MFGLSTSEFVGTNLSVIKGDGSDLADHDSLFESLSDGDMDSIVGKKHEFVARHKNGTIFSAQLSLNPVQISDEAETLYSAFVVPIPEKQSTSVDDVSEESNEDTKTRNGSSDDASDESHDYSKVTNVTKAMESEELKWIFDSCRDGIFVTSKDRLIKRVNKSAALKFGRDQESLINIKLDSLLSADDAEWLKSEIDQFLNDGLPFYDNIELEAKHRDGTSFMVSLQISELRDDDGDIVFIFFVNDLTEQKKMIELEVERTAQERLLMNVLPKAVALQLKHDPEHIADYYANTSVLFAHIVGFASMPQKLQPRKVVEMLNELFGMFDNILEKHNLSKIKTAGETYVVANVPPRTTDHFDDCVRMCDFALELRQAIQEFNKKRSQSSLELRMGMNYGPVVAGVVGTKQYLFDLWGETVTVASEMVDCGVAGRCHVSKAVVDFVGNEFLFEKLDQASETESFLLKRRLGSGVSSKTLRRASSASSHRSERSRQSLRESLKALEFAISKTDFAWDESSSSVKISEEKR